MAQQQAKKNICENRKARHEYHILETYEAGISLVGTEVKSLRNHQASLQEAYCMIESGEIFLNKMHIAVYEHGNRFNHDPKRKRRLLLHKKEIRNLYAKAKEKGLTIMPLRMYFVRGLAKVEIALCRGKKMYDKRQDIKDKVVKRETDRALRDRQKEF